MKKKESQRRSKRPKDKDKESEKKKEMKKEEKKEEAKEERKPPEKETEVEIQKEEKKAATTATEEDKDVLKKENMFDLDKTLEEKDTDREEKEKNKDKKVEEKDLLPDSDNSKSQARVPRAIKKNNPDAELRKIEVKDKPQATKEAQPNSTPRSRDTATASSDIDDWLDKQDYYHGFLPREDIGYILQQAGDFLVRSTEVETGSGAKTKELIVSVLGSSDAPLLDEEAKNDAARNIIVHRRGNKVSIDTRHKFDSLEELFRHYSKSPVIIQKNEYRFLRGSKLARWEFAHKDVAVGKVVGQGAFGEVRKGSLVKKSGRVVQVAIKTLKGSQVEISKEKVKEMMKEARLMRNLSHPNIVRIYGVCLLKHPLYIILEFVPGGALGSYLKKHGATIDRDERLQMTMGAAWGLEYLHKKEILHRDIAARNCLYDNNKNVKLSDFGLSRNAISYKMKTAKKMPIKWMAPESISTFQFSQKTDVYSFGILVYEIFSGLEPYEGKPNSQVRKMIIGGQLNTFPDSTPSKLKTYVEEKLWSTDPGKRNNMQHIVFWLEKYTGLQLLLSDDTDTKTVIAAVTHNPKKDKQGTQID